MMLSLCRLSVFALSFLFCLSGWAQVNPQAPLPLDPAVRTGKLPNGMTYYIRKNGYPEKRAEFRLAVNAGSLLETDEQQGLAHFAEHMCFNGTKNFPKNSLVDFLELSGTKFGAHLNAYTSFDETVYMLRSRTDTADLFDKSMLIMEEWAHNVSFDEVEIDKERGVVIEEWRLRRGAQARMRDKYFPVLFHNSRYAERLPIGKKDILETFKYETIREFYRDWYRPDLMAIVVVGDFDLDKVEKMVKERFSKIPALPNPKPRTEYTVPLHDQTLVSIVTDKEASRSGVQICNKFNYKRTGTYQDLIYALKESLVSQMIRARLDEQVRSKDAPFAFAYGFGNDYGPTTHSFTYFSVCGDDKIKNALRALLTENKRAIQFGFTQGELDRAIAELLTGYEKQFNERDKRESDKVAMEFVRHYLDKEAAPGIEEESRVAKELLKSLKLAEVNTFAQNLMQEKSRVIIITAPEKEGVDLPTEAEVLAIVKEVGNTQLQGYKDEAMDAPLLSTLPKGGKINQTKEFKDVGFTEWVLSNGAKVWIKPTNFKNDEIIFHAFSLGGTSLHSDADYVQADFCTDVTEWMGYGKFSPIQMEKKMAGKYVQLSPYVSDFSEGLQGNCTPQDFETFMQLLYLTMTEPRISKDDFEVLKQNMKIRYKNRSLSPEATFYDTLSVTMASHHPRSRPFTEDRVDEINMEKAVQIFKQRFANAADFTFVFVGNIDPVKHKDLIEKYIGGLPTQGPKENWKDVGIRTPKGVVTKTVKKGKEPKAMVSIAFPSSLEWSGQSRTTLKMACEVLAIKLRENLRESQGGVYGVSCSPNMTRYPNDHTIIYVRFGCSPDNVEKLVAAVFEEIVKIKMNGPEETDLNKVRETNIRSLETDAKENRYWLGVATSALMHQDQMSSVDAKVELIKSIKAKDIQEAIKKHCNESEHIKVILMPEN